jgi:hexosaminidase
MVESHLPHHSKSTFKLEHRNRIIVHEDTSTHSSVLLLDYASTFSKDLSEVLSVDVPPPAYLHDQPQTSSSNVSTIDLIIAPNSFTYFNDAPSFEGYELSITSERITINGAHPLGVWWGT